jgi:hypothetical protein
MRPLVVVAVCVVLAGAVTTVLFLRWHDGGSGRDPRRPGREASLRRRIAEHGPLLVKGDARTDTYWLIVLPAGRRAPEQHDGLIALYPHIGSQSCLVKPRLQGKVFDDCEGGTYDPADLQKYGLEISTTGLVTVDTSHHEDIQPTPDGSA